MRVGVQMPLKPWAIGGPRPSIVEMMEAEIAEDGKLGKWLRIHGLFEDCHILEYSGAVIVECTDDQYMELLLGFKGVYFVEIISK